MTAHMSATLTLVQLDDTSKVYCWVSYGSGDSTQPQYRTEQYVDHPEDVTDCRDWIRQALVAVVEGL